MPIASTRNLVGDVYCTALVIMNDDEAFSEVFKIYQFITYILFRYFSVFQLVFGWADTMESGIRHV